MGSPFECVTTSRVHCVTTDRGAAMILNKILTSAAGYEAKMQRGLCFRIIETLRLDPLALKRSADGIEEFDLFNQLAELNDHWVILSGFLDAYLLSNARCSRVVTTFSARYAWKGFERFECVVVFDTGLKSLQRGGLSVSDSLLATTLIS